MLESKLQFWRHVCVNAVQFGIRAGELNCFENYILVAEFVMKVIHWLLLRRFKEQPLKESVYPRKGIPSY